MTCPLDAVIPDESRGQRLDQALAALFPDFSRTRLKNWLEQGRVLVDGRVLRPKDIVTGGERVAVTPVDAPVVEVAPEAIALAMVHEDPAFFVIDKPAGLVVHPGAGNPRATLQNALLYRDPSLARLPRAGIVHRIDKETSGLLVVARTPEAHARLTKALAVHAVGRVYEAVTNGVMTAGGTVDAPIDRHPVDRLRMAVRGDGRPAVTHYRVIERFRAHTHVRVELETGRTHQIRVHLAHAGFPLLGDPLYGRRVVIPRKPAPGLEAALRGFRRQALHAARLAFDHPDGSGRVEFAAPLPADFATLVAALRADVRLAAADPRERG
jgi:23S rRNA pseudouridine1911/1915/1917 synthase